MMIIEKGEAAQMVWIEKDKVFFGASFGRNDKCGEGWCIQLKLSSRVWMQKMVEKENEFVEVMKLRKKILESFQCSPFVFRQIEFESCTLLSFFLMFYLQKAISQKKINGQIEFSKFHHKILVPNVHLSPLLA